ncbi:MAG TPA: hypothetical protein VF411_10760 [Bacteroidia bacterium]
MEEQKLTPPAPPQKQPQKQYPNETNSGGKTGPRENRPPKKKGKKT